MATGDGVYTKETRNYREDLTVSIKGATIEGDFDRYTVMAWINYDISPYKDTGVKNCSTPKK